MYFCKTKCIQFGNLGRDRDMPISLVYFALCLHFLGILALIREIEMSLVEGVGDEVTQFFVALLIVGLSLLAWWSTNISETPLVRTVLVLERRRVEVRVNHNCIHMISRLAVFRLHLLEVINSN
jgi:hypothetical protein